MQKQNATNNEIIPVAVYARVSTEHEAQVLALDNQLSWYDDIIDSSKSDIVFYVDMNDK